MSDPNCALPPEIPVDEPARHGERPEDLPPPHHRQRGEWHLQGRKCERRESTTGSTAATGLPSGVNCPECMEAMAPVTVEVDFQPLLEGLDGYPGGLELNFRLRGTVFYGVTYQVRDMQVVSASEGWREKHPSDSAKDDAEQWLGVTKHHIDAVQALVESARKAWCTKGLPETGVCDSCGGQSNDLCVCYRCKRAVCPSCSVLYLEDPSYRCMREQECEEAR